MDQPKGEKESGPHLNNEEKDLIFQLKNTSISAETKIEIIQCAVSKCPKVCIGTHGIQIPSLLDSGSEVTLLQQLYLKKNTSCQKLNQQQGRKLMLTICLN